ncbi:MAG: hypothetical protein WCF84_07685 [Anaerolineae bacterium]
MKFPLVQSSNLSGKRYRLPGDFEGEYNIVLVPFQRHQQDNVDTWGPLLEQLAARYPTLRYYELPTLPDMGRLQRFFIDSGMRGGIPDPRVRARTITLYLDVTAFNAALNLPTIDEIYVLLVTRAGDVLWRASGDYTADKGQALSARLEELFAADPASPRPRA